MDLTATSGIEDEPEAKQLDTASAAVPGELSPSRTEPPTPDGFPYGDLDPAIASAAQDAATYICSLGRTEVLTAIETGRALLAIKDRLPHGQFGRWTEAEFGWSERTAQRYMRLSKAFGAISDTVSDLPVAILHRLAATSTKPELRDAILARLEAGERLRSEDILKLLRPEPPQEQQQDGDSTPSAAGREASGPQPGASTATMASVAQESLPAVEAAEAAARIIIARLGSDLDRLAEMLQRADPHHLLETILSHAQKQPEAGRALDQPHAEGGHEAQPEILANGNEESVSPGDAASEAPVPEDASVARNAAADPESAGRTPAVVAIPSGGETAGTNGSDSPDLTIPGFLHHQPPPAHLCIQPTGGSPTKSEAEVPAGEGPLTSMPLAQQTPIPTSGADRAHDRRSEPTHRRGPTRRVPKRSAQGRR